MLKQLHVVNSAAVVSGGEGLPALRYAQELSGLSSAVTLVSRDVDIEDEVQSSFNERFEQQSVPSRQGVVLNMYAQYRFLSQLCEHKEFDLVHIHGMWSPLLVLAAIVAYRRNIPLLISPHGCLEPWALRNKYYKKLLAMKTYQERALRTASLLVATSDQELRNLRRLVAVSRSQLYPTC